MFFIIPRIGWRTRRKVVALYSFLEERGLLVETPDGEIALKVHGNLYADGYGRYWIRDPLRGAVERAEHLEELRDKLLETLKSVEEITYTELPSGVRTWRWI